MEWEERGKEGGRRRRKGKEAKGMVKGKGKERGIKIETDESMHVS